jgi:pilus assembly protein Flp/PilA
MLRTFKHLMQDESGATAIEYGLIAALVSVAAITALQAMGTSLKDIFGIVSDELNEAASGVAGSGT